MNPDPAPAFRSDLSDEAAAALCDFLHELAVAADSRYLHQILRYRRPQAPPVDPNQSWLFPPTSPDPSHHLPGARPSSPFPGHAPLLNLIQFVSINLDYFGT